MSQLVCDGGNAILLLNVYLHQQIPKFYRRAGAPETEGLDILLHHSHQITSLLKGLKVISLKIEDDSKVICFDSLLNFLYGSIPRGPNASCVAKPPLMKTSQQYKSLIYLAAFAYFPDCATPRRYSDKPEEHSSCLRQLYHITPYQAVRIPPKQVDKR